MLNGSLNNKFSQQGLVSNLSDIKDIGLYYIQNSSEMPDINGWYAILSLSKQDGSTIPMIAMDEFADNLEQLVVTANDLKNNGVTMYFLKDQIDTSCSLGKLLLEVVGNRLDV